MKNNNNNNNNNNKQNNLIKPLLTFYKPMSNKLETGKLLNNKAGIYQWYNPINGCSYIDSSINLKNGFNEYCYGMKSNRFNSTLTRGNSIILNALFKNGMDSFEFRILEFISSDNNDLRNKLLPEYNILKIAGSNRGHKLSTETRAKMSKAKKLHYSLKPSLRKGSKVSEQTRLLMSKNNKIAKKVFVYKSTDTSELGLLHIFDSITQACASLNYYPTRFIKYINTKLILDNKYIVSWEKLTKESIVDYCKSKKSGKKASNVYVYLVDEKLNPKILAFNFNSVLECSKFFDLHKSSTYRLINGSLENNTFNYLDNNYILSKTPLL